MTYFAAFYIFLIIQRISELFLAKKNETATRKQGAVEYDKDGYKYIVLLHTGFLISFIAEFFFLDRHLNRLSLLFFIIFILTQILRYWALSSLGIYWNTKILVVPGLNLVKKGPYKYIKHPNYFAVITEIAVIPLIFSCYFTSIVFTLLNLITLRRRIRIEEKALGIK
ncbi:MAG: isoprenylcysteine carboxyl methyltransferase family protein [Thermodesulfobacteriota bacterium]